MNKLGFVRDLDNNLSVQNISVNYLVKKYGTPLFIYDSKIIETTYQKINKAIKPVNGKIHYAVKANDNLGLIKFISELGSGADVVSIGELQKCLKVGMDPKKIIFSGVGKDVNEIEYAISKNIKQINIESKEELVDIIDITTKLKKNANIALRVNLDINAQTHKKISTGDENSKFGISFKDVPDIYNIVTNSEYLTPFGLAVHIGSQIFNYKIFAKAYKQLKNLAKNLIENGFPVKYLDLGGGFGVDYKNILINDFKELKKITTNLFINENFDISVEPGRSLVANSGILITKIIRTKLTKKKNFLIVDAGMNNLIRPTLYNAFHEIIPLSLNNDRECEQVDIVGPICETGDFFALNRKIQKMYKNEFLAIMSAGAYGSVMKSNYNTRPDASEVFIYNNKDYLLKKKHSVEKIINSEIIPKI